MRPPPSPPQTLLGASASGREGMQSSWAAAATSGHGGSRVSTSDEMRGNDAAAPGAGDAGNDYMSAMDGDDDAARGRRKRHGEAEGGASGATDETIGGGGGGDGGGSNGGTFGDDGDDGDGGGDGRSGGGGNDGDGDGDGGTTDSLPRKKQGGDAKRMAAAKRKAP